METIAVEIVADRSDLEILPSAEDIPVSEVETQIGRKARQLRNSVEKSLTLYRELLAGLRNSELSIKEKRRALISGGGWPKSYASKFLALAEAPDGVFQPYMAGQIGFKAAVIKAQQQRKPKTEPEKRAIRKERLWAVAHTFDKTFFTTEGEDMLLVAPGLAAMLDTIGKTETVDGGKYRAVIERVK